MLLFDAVTKLGLKALYLPDRRRILLDESLPILKHRWNEAHEITHSILPWHLEMMLGDDQYTLKPVFQESMEHEANYGAGQFLFLGKRFSAAANDMQPTIANVQALQREFKNTITSTFWRYIESSHPDLPLAGAVTVHPHMSRRPRDFDPQDPCRYYIRSRAFARRFADVAEQEIFRSIASYSGSQRGGPLGSDEIVLCDTSGDEHIFAFETFYNTHEALTLISYVRPRPTLVGVHAP